MCTADRARRAAARLAQDEESQGLARRWRSLHRALTSDRGLWSDGDVSQTCHWKLDKSEDPQRRWGVFHSLHLSLKLKRILNSSKWEVAALVTSCLTAAVLGLQALEAQA